MTRNPYEQYKTNSISTATPAELTLRTEGTDLYTSSRVSGKVTLDGYGTMVIKL